MIELANARVLVTGAAGMTGDAVLRRLLREHPKIQLRATFRTETGEFADPQIQWIQADLTERDSIELAAKGCDYLIHCAASTGGASSAINEPSRQMTDNIVMDTYVLEGAHIAGVRRWIYLSSATVYQEFDGSIREDQLDLNAEPHPAYLGVGWAKRAAEKFCRFWHEKYDHQIVILRCSNIYGPRDRFDPQRSNFIPALIRKAVAHQDPFEIWGDPNVRRDVIYCDDVAAAIDAALTSDLDFETFNLGAGIVTVGEVAQYALRAAGHSPSVEKFLTDRPTTIATRALDCRKIQQRLNFRPTIDAAEGIVRTTRWWMDHQKTWAR